MSTLALACRRRHLNPAWIIAALAAAGLGALAVAVVQLVTTAGPVLLVAGCLLLAGWLVQVVAAVGPLGWLLGAVVLVAVCPWLVPAALLCLALMFGGVSDA